MGYKIKEMRELRKISQEELAAKSGVSRTTISTLENDPEKETMISTLKKIAKALDVSVDQLFSA